MPTLQELQKAVSIAEKIEALQSQLDAILDTPTKKSAKAAAIVESEGESEDAPKKRGPKPGSKRGRKAKNAGESTTKETLKKRGPKKGSKRVLSPEALEKIREGQKRRWAKAGK